MLEEDKTVINILCEENVEFKELFDEHIRFEQDLEALYSTSPITPLIESKIKEIKLLKLRGKDKYHSILSEYKKNNNL